MLLGFLALADISDEGVEHGLITLADCGYSQFYGELGPVPAATDRFADHPDPGTLTRFREFTPVPASLGAGTGLAYQASTVDQQDCVTN